MPDKPLGRLDSWKHIARYLGRDVRTVIRWEHERGLPVHRIPGKKGHGVFAERAEIDSWLLGSAKLDQPRRIAVLPLTNMVRPGHEHVADGISENVIRSLSKVPALRVMAWTTVVGFRTSGGDPVQLGRQLGLNAIAAGRVAQRNGFWQIHIELIDPADGAQLWGKEYTKPAMDIRGLPDQIARDILGVLEIRIDKADAARLRASRTVDPRAYDLLLLGRHYLNQFTKDSLAQALHCLHKASEIDPQYPEVYAELAQCYVFLGVGYGDTPPAEILAKAEAAAQTAVALDGTIGEAHCALAMASIYRGWDWRFVEKQFKLAIELSPSSAIAHVSYATLLNALGRIEEGIEEGRWGMELDPLAPIATCDHAFALALAGRVGEALELLEPMLQRFPNFPAAHYILGVAHERAGRYDRAIEAIQKTLAMDVLHTIPIGVLGNIYAKTGNRDKAIELLTRLDNLGKLRPAAHFTKALIYDGLFEIDTALQCLEKAYHDKSPWLYMLNWYPWLNNVRTQPAFTDLVTKVGLPPPRADKI